MFRTSEESVPPVGVPVGWSLFFSFRRIRCNKAVGNVVQDFLWVVIKFNRGSCYDISQFVRICGLGLSGPTYTHSVVLFINRVLQ
jgi:hypothetical protein